MKGIRVNNEVHFEDPVDFPCSYSFRAYYRETMFGEVLPDIEQKETMPQDIEVRHTYFHVDNSRRITAKLNALDGAVKYLLEKEKQKGGKKKYQGSYF